MYFFPLIVHIYLQGGHYVFMTEGLCDLEFIFMSLYLLFVFLSDHFHSIRFLLFGIFYPETFVDYGMHPLLKLSFVLWLKSIYLPQLVTEDVFGGKTIFERLKIVAFELI